jgi:membrane dipeptidase
VLIVDGHLDLAWNGIQWERDLREPVATLRAREQGREGPGRGRNTVALPELRAGRVAVALASLLARSTGTPVEGLDYPTAAEASAVAGGQLAYYRTLEREGLVRVLEDAAALSAHVRLWRAWDEAGEGAPPALGVVLMLEGADPVAAPAELHEWRTAGARIVGLAHYGPGRYAGGTGTTDGLSDLGRALVGELDAAGMALDLTHASDAAADEALRRFDGIVLATHCNCRALVARQRQLSDELILAIAERGGVIGAALDCWMLDEGWVIGQQENAVPLTAVADHIDHVCQLTGSSAHAAIGSDLDGGFGREQSPVDLDTVADLQRLAEILRERGYAEADVEAVMSGNWLRLLDELLGQEPRRNAFR